MAWHGPFMIEIIVVSLRSVIQQLLTKKGFLIKKLLIFLTITGTLFSSCSQNPSNRYNKDSASFDLDSIVARGKLVAVTDFNSTNYFLYKGEPMGFHYELLEAFSDHLGVDIEMIQKTALKMPSAFSGADRLIFLQWG